MHRQLSLGVGTLAYFFLDKLILRSCTALTNRSLTLAQLMTVQMLRR